MKPRKKLDEPRKLKPCFCGIVFFAAFFFFPLIIAAEEESKQMEKVFLPLRLSVLQSGKAEDAKQLEIFELKATKSFSLNYEYSRIENPPRLVLDFRGLKLKKQRTVELQRTMYVKSVRSGIQQGAARIVFDLKDPTLFSRVEEAPNSLRVLISKEPLTEEVNLLAAVIQQETSNDTKAVAEQIEKRKGADETRGNNEMQAAPVNLLAAVVQQERSPEINSVKKEAKESTSTEDLRLSFDREILHLLSVEDQVEDLKVKNEGNVAVRISALFSAVPESWAAEKLVASEEMISIAPKSFALQPGEIRSVRVRPSALALENVANIEKAYRLAFVRSVFPAGDKAEESQVSTSLSAAVLVLLAPEDAEGKLGWSRSGEKLTFRNEGRASLELASGRACSVEGKNCSALPRFRLFPAEERTLDIPSAATVECLVESGGAFQTVNIPPELVLVEPQ